MTSWIWFRMDAARRWRSLAALALLIALSGASVLAAVAGARRGESALPRLTQRTLPATAEVAVLQPGFDWEVVRALPEVEVLATYVDTDFRIQGIPAENLSVGYPPVDDALMRTIERPVVLRGRLADPDRADEAVVTHQFVTTYHKGVGDTVTAMLMTPEEAQGALGITGPTPSGPRIQIRIVGVVRSPWFSDGPQSHGSLLPTPALTEHYLASSFNDYSWTSALVRLRGGAAAVPTFREHLAAVLGRTDVLVDSLPEKLQHRERAAAFEATWLFAFGLVAFLAALVLVGQALTRYVSASLSDLTTLRALGMTRAQAVVAATVGPVLAGVLGGAAAAAGAVVVSPWFPIGSAAADEPAPGFDVDLLVLGSGLAVIVLLVLSASAVSTWLAASSLRHTRTSGPSAIASAASAAHLPVPVIVGARFALESRRGPDAVPVRPALLGAVAGVLGVVAAFTFSAGVTEAAGNPARFGLTWQLESWLGYSGKDATPPDLLRSVARDPDVAAVNDVRAAVATEPRTREAVLMYSYSPVGRPVAVVLQAGRMPATAEEIVLAPESATALHARVGDSVSLSGTTVAPRTMTVTGIGFVPAGSHCTGCSHASGAWVSDEGFDTVFQTFRFHVGLVALRPGADPRAVAARLQRLAPGLDGQDLFAPPYPPSAITELRRVRPFPLALGVFLALLAVAAVGHAVASAVRRRRHDVAVLRALGMTRPQTGLVVLTQASVLAAAGLLFGVPLGVAAGRTLWRVVAEYTPLQYVPPLAALALLTVGPLTLVVANLLATWPGWQAARLRIGQVLRSE